jgi:quinol monooxygenase YgiN
MAVSLVTFKVKDYDNFLTHFRADAPHRAAAGCKGVHLFRNSDDGNEVVINFQWEDRARAEAMMAEPQMQDRFAEAGLLGAPMVIWVDDAGREPA